MPLRVNKLSSHWPTKFLSRRRYLQCTGQHNVGSGMAITNYHNVCLLSCIMNTVHSQSIFFKETT